MERLGLVWLRFSPSPSIDYLRELMFSDREFVDYDNRACSLLINVGEL